MLECKSKNQCNPDESCIKCEIIKDRKVCIKCYFYQDICKSLKKKPLDTCSVFKDQQ